MCFFLTIEMQLNLSISLMLNHTVLANGNTCIISCMYFMYITCYPRTQTYMFINITSVLLQTILVHVSMFSSLLDTMNLSEL